MADSPTPQTAHQRYEALKQDREPYLMRAREAAELTIPALMPPEGHNGTSKLVTPYQSTGSRGVNNLAAKLLLALFPPGTSFFRFTLDDFVVEELRKKVGGDEKEFASARADFDAALEKMERAVTNRMEQTGARTTLFECLKHLVVAGNGLIQVLPKGRLKFFPLSKYVVKRDLQGNVLDIVIEEETSRAALSESALRIVEEKDKSKDEHDEKSNDKSLCIYTRVTKTPKGSWTVHQEILDTPIPGTEAKFPKGKSQFLPLRFIAVDGEDYGRGHVEEYIGDLYSLESGSKSIITFSAAVAKILVMVNESGMTSKKKVAQAPNGAVVDGRAQDVTFLQVEKAQDFGVLKAVVDDIKQNLKECFLMTSSVQRQAERVTAEEIRLMAGELEQSLGGVYSVLAQELQQPLVTVVLGQMQRERALPPLPDGAVSPQIVTGLDGLGRASDLQKLDTFVAGVPQTLAEAVAGAINISDYMTRRGSALGIDTTGLVKTEEQMAQEAQAAHEAEVQKETAPAGVKAASDVALAKMQQNSTQEAA